MSRKTQLPQARTHRASLRNKSPNGRGLSLRGEFEWSVCGHFALVPMHRQAAERPRSTDLSRLRLFIRAAHVTEIEGQIILFAKHLSSSLHKTALNLVIDPSIGWMSLNRVRTSQRLVLGYLPVRQIWSRCCHWRKSPRNPRLYAIWNIQLINALRGSRT